MRGDPFAATGVAIGTFVLRPAIEIGGIATDNAAGGARTGRPLSGSSSRPKFELEARDDSRYEILGGRRAPRQSSMCDEEVDEREADARLFDARYALTDARPS